jgi:hypothetical protein
MESTSDNTASSTEVRKESDELLREEGDKTAEGDKVAQVEGEGDKGKEEAEKLEKIGTLMMMYLYIIYISI